MSGAVTPSRHAARFVTTRWSIVCAAAAHPRDETGRVALASLCQSYWYPLYAFARRCGYDAEAASDLTQAFFARLLEKNYVSDADRTRGRFRTFLLASLKHFLANEANRERALKRGGGRAIVSIDVADAESRFRSEPAHALTAEKLFDRQWALALLESVLSGLREEYAAVGKVKLFDVLRPSLTFAPDAESYERIARDLGTSAGGVKIAVHRMRQRYRRRLRHAIADSVEHERDVEDEIRSLFEALSTSARA